MGLWQYDVFVKEDGKWLWITNPEDHPNGILDANLESVVEQAEAQDKENVIVLRRCHQLIRFKNGERDE